MSHPIIPDHIPKKSSAAYKVARLIYDTYPKTDAELNTVLDLGNRRLIWLSIDAAIESGWLRRVLDRYELTGYARTYFDTEPVKFAGQVAAPRIVNVMASKAYSPPKRMVRDDVPVWSVRSGTTFFTKA